MTGWLTVVTLVVVQIALAVVLVRWAARRWWDFLAVAAVAVLLVRPVLDTLTDDVSRYLPLGLFSDGSPGKDQIIIASALSTLLLPVVLAAVIVGIVNWGRRTFASGQQG